MNEPQSVEEEKDVGSLEGAEGAANNHDKEMQDDAAAAQIPLPYRAPSVATASGDDDLLREESSPAGDSSTAEKHSYEAPKAATVKSRKTWKKPEGMPKRPLSAYNIFFRVERQRILGEGLSKEYEITDQSKRKHRKTHGKVGFAEMAQKISSKWKSMSATERQPFEQDALVEKQRYTIEVKQWRKEREQLMTTESSDEIFRKISLEKSSSAEDPTIGATETTSDDEKAKASVRGDEGEVSEEFKQNRKGLETTVSHDTSSPRSETAAFLVTLPSTSRDGGAFMATAPSLPQTASLHSDSLAPHHIAIPDSRPPPFIVQASPALPTSNAAFAPGAAMTMSRLAPMTTLSSRSSWPAGSNERMRHVEEMYRMHLAEAASLRAELERQMVEGSENDTAAIHMAWARPAERRWSDTPSTSYSQFGHHQQLGSTRRFSVAPMQLQPAYLVASPPLTRVHPEVAASQLAPAVSSSVVSDLPLVASGSSLSQPQEDMIAREQARQDLIALERAAELRRADLVALDQRVSGGMGASAWGVIQPHHLTGSTSSQFTHHQQLQQAGLVSFTQGATLPDRVSLEEARRRAEEEVWLQRQGYGQQPP